MLGSMGRGQHTSMPIDVTSAPKDNNLPYPLCGPFKGRQGNPTHNMPNNSSVSHSTQLLKTYIYTSIYTRWCIYIYIHMLQTMNCSCRTIIMGKVLLPTLAIHERAAHCRAQGQPINHRQVLFWATLWDSSTEPLQCIPVRNLISQVVENHFCECWFCIDGLVTKFLRYR